MTIIPDKEFDKIKAELAEIDESYVEVDGKQLKSSGCYYFGANPAHILYNTNCPDTLKKKINQIILKYLPNENSA